MNRLPQSVLTHIYEYDPTYRVEQHRRQMAELRARADEALYAEDAWVDVDFTETVAFQMLMYFGTTLFVVLGVPIYLFIIGLRLILIISGVLYLMFRRPL